MYFPKTGELKALSEVQARLLTDARTILEALAPSKVDPALTCATMTGRSLRLTIPHSEREDWAIEIRAEPSGELGIYCTPELYFKFNDPYEPWESAGDYTEGLDLIRALLSGEIEIHRSTSRGRVIRTRYFRRDGKGGLRSMGQQTHIPNLLGGLVSRRHAEIDRPDFG